MMGRTLVNATETCVLVLVTYLWTLSWPGVQSTVTDRGGSDGSDSDRKEQQKGSLNKGWLEAIAVALMAASSCARPTIALFWLPTLLERLQRVVQADIDNTSLGGGGTRNYVWYVLRSATAALVSVYACAMMDGYCYGLRDSRPYGPILPALHFYAANVGRDVASLYGQEPWHWCLTNGLPSLLGLFVPLFVYSVFRHVYQYVYPATRTVEDQDTVGIESGTSLLPAPLQLFVWLSVLHPLLLQIISSHQEVRFLLLSLPGLCILMAHSLVDSPSLEGLGAWGSWFPGHADAFCAAKAERGRGTNWLGLLLGALPCLLHIMAAMYLLFFHQAGTETAMSYVGKHVAALQPYDLSQKSNLNGRSHVNVVVFAPCHAFPGYSFIHRPMGPDRVSVRLLMPDCSPDLRREVVSAFGQSESVAFEKSPRDFVESFRSSRSGIMSKMGIMKKIKKFTAKDTDNDTSTNVSVSASASAAKELALGWADPDIIVTFDAYEKDVREVYTKTMSPLPYQAPRSKADVSLRRVRTFHHSHMRYDYDDPRQEQEEIMGGVKLGGKRRVAVYSRFKPESKAKCPFHYFLPKTETEKGKEK